MPSQRLLERYRERSVAGAARARMLAGIPGTQRRLEFAHASTVVWEGGDGPPMVLLHGGVECGGAYWGTVTSRLAERFHLVVPDVPGLGESDPVARWDERAFAAWFARLLRHTCYEQPTLVAHSLLGGVAARFAARHGELLRRLVLYSVPALGQYRPAVGLRRAAAQASRWPSERHHQGYAQWALFDPTRTRQRDPGWYEALGAYRRSRVRMPHVERMMGQLSAAETRQIPDSVLERITVPTALLWGRQDRIVGLGAGQRVSARFGWPLHVVDDAGHMPHIEQPESFLRALNDIESTVL
jgi:2-hydroxymuconate-semialdehyde hydrolase